MPLQVRASPEYLPQILSSYIGRLGERVLANDRWIVPLRANLEYFDALPIQPVANVEFWTYPRRRSVLGQENRHGIFDALNVKIVECHGLYLVKQGDLRTPLYSVKAFWQRVSYANSRPTTAPQSFHTAAFKRPMRFGRCQIGNTYNPASTGFQQTNSACTPKRIGRENCFLSYRVMIPSFKERLMSCP